ncbi:hypothetical protein [Chamaesiphon sp.]|uniref:hypothetical protein n=1 Tax=Chamaesiphon sp. TaxID=2814140 RepID=UPI0035940935
MIIADETTRIFPGAYSILDNCQPAKIDRHSRSPILVLDWMTKFCDVGTADRNDTRDRFQQI